MDIAGELGDYLNDLEEINFTFDGGNTNLNFAEAALLIQGSACIYSKKVEYLHALVFQALDFVADKKRQEDAAANGLIVDDEDGQDEATFLALDDCLDEAESTAIDLDDADFFKSLAAGPSADADFDAGVDMVDVTNDEAAALRQNVDAPPARVNLAHSALLQMIQGKDGGEGVEYKMSSCSVHPSGALVLDAADVNSLDSRLAYFDRSAGSGAGAVDAAAAWLTEANRSPSAAEGGAVDDDAAAMAPAPMDDDDNDFGGGGFADDDGGTFAQEAAASLPAPAPAPAQQQRREDEEEEDEEDDFDPYAPLDMHDPNGLPLRPYKKGRPGGAKALLKKKDTAAAATAMAVAVAADGGSSSADDVESMVLSLLAAAAAGAGADAATGKAEFAYALQSLECSRRALRLKTKGGKKTVTATGDLLGLGASAAAAAAGDGEYDDEGDDDGWAGAGGFDDDDDAGGYEDVEEGQNAEGGLAGLVGTATAAAAGEAGEMTYEELCQAHINKFLAAAAAAEVQSELATRVQTWKSRVDPSIAEQDAREQFDIHVYGSRVIGRLADNVAATKAIAAPGDDSASDDDAEYDAAAFEMGFGDVVAGQEKWQVARMFASMLQLINNGNVAVEQHSAAALALAPGPSSGPAAAAEKASKIGSKKKGGKAKEVDEGEDEERPAGAAYSTLDTGELKLRLLTSNIRELNISAARHREADEVLALPAAEDVEQEAEEDGEEAAEKEKPAAAKKQRGRPKKTAASASVVTKTVEPEGGRATRDTRRGALADNKQR